MIRRPPRSTLFPLHDALPIFQVRAGSRFETPEMAGITNFLLRTMIRGTSRRSATELAEAAEEIGGSLDASGEVESAEIRGEALRSEEHTSELQSQSNHVCRLL